MTHDLYLIPRDRVDLDGNTFISTAMLRAKMVWFGRVVLQSPSVNSMF